MTLSVKAKNICRKVNDKNAKLGDLRQIAKEIKTDHALAMELWSSGELMPRLLAVLIMDKKQLSQEMINKFEKDMLIHEKDEQIQLMDWLMANQLSKEKKSIALIESWANSSSALQRRIYWYYQARKRWTGQPSPGNTPELLSEIEKAIADEKPEVQWAMNFTAAWIGVFDEKHRKRCINLGERTGLYKDEVVAKGCTPGYLPEFIRIEVAKRKK